MSATLSKWIVIMPVFDRYMNPLQYSTAHWEWVTVFVAETTTLVYSLPSYRAVTEKCRRIWSLLAKSFTSVQPGVDCPLTCIVRYTDNHGLPKSAANKLIGSSFPFPNRLWTPSDQSFFEYALPYLQHDISSLYNQLLASIATSEQIALGGKILQLNRCF